MLGRIVEIQRECVDCDDRYGGDEVDQKAFEAASACVLDSHLLPHLFAICYGMMGIIAALFANNNS